MRLVMAQLNPILGDVRGNQKQAEVAYALACEQGADIVVFSELFLSGYPPADLVLKPSFTKTIEQALSALAQKTQGGPAMIMGAPIKYDNKIYNAALLLADGKICATQYKIDLPNYREFDEKRFFSAGSTSRPMHYRGLKFGVLICEDIWNDEARAQGLVEQGAEFIFVLNGSPYYRDKMVSRLRAAQQQVRRAHVPLIYVNQVGGQDELVFDGGSFALDATSNVVLQLGDFTSCVDISHWRRDETGWCCINPRQEVILNGVAADYHACMLGLSDYINKNRFKGVVLGLSGGVDSALCASLAVDALGKERVHSVMLPYHYTSQASLNDAKECAALLGCRYDIVPIYQPVEGFLAALAGLFAGQNPDVTEENLQSRCRGTLLMALSNKFGSMLLTTGNKSELSVGYTTLYGDMNGGFNPIKDLYKTEVYALCAWRNAHRPRDGLGPIGRVIPQQILEKAPTAELHEGQLDEDSLPPYPVLDDILRCLVEDDMDIAQVIARGHDYDTVKRTEQLLYLAEYKRRQSALGVKISRKNFGQDRRYPITNYFRDELRKPHD